MDKQNTEEERKKIWDMHYHNRDYYWANKNEYDKSIEEINK